MLFVDIFCHILMDCDVNFEIKRNPVFDSLAKPPAFSVDARGGGIARNGRATLERNPLAAARLPTEKCSAIGSGCFSRWLIVQDEDSFLRGFYFEQRKIEPLLQISEERHSPAQNDGVNLEPVVVD